MKIMIAVDGSDCSNRAIRSVGEQQWPKDAQFLVVSVVEPIPADVGVGYFPAGTGYTEKQYDDCAQFCGQAAAELQAALTGYDVSVRVVSGMVAETICETAEGWDADLIVVGSHGRKGLSHFLLGSVAEEVLKKSPCSVEVVKIKRKLQVEAKKSKKKEKQSLESAKA